MLNNKKLIITIDGPAASGKGTIAKALASYLDYEVMHTGTHYRALAKSFLKHNIDYSLEENIINFLNLVNFESLDFRDLNTEEIASIATVIASKQIIRDFLLKIQQNYIRTSKKGIVIEGRDAGSVICPDAEVKFFLDADIKIRANRRFKELQDMGFSVIYEEIINDLISRDMNDKSRIAAPLIKPEGAFVIDSTYNNPEQVIQLCLSHINEFIKI